MRRSSLIIFQVTFESDGKLIWYHGTILEVNQGKVFKVTHDDVDVYFFDLLDDIASGDLLICS